MFIEIFRARCPNDQGMDRHLTAPQIEVVEGDGGQWQTGLVKGLGGFVQSTA